MINCQCHSVLITIFLCLDNLRCELQFCLFKFILTILCSCFHIHFIGCYNKYKGILTITGCVTPVDQFGENWHLNNINFSCEHLAYFFHLIMYYLDFLYCVIVFRIQVLHIFYDTHILKKCIFKYYIWCYCTFYISDYC